MTIILPTMHRGAAYALKPVTASEVQRSGTGGSLTPLNRTGDHWALEVDVGVLATECGMELLADLVRGTAERIRVPIPQPGVDTGTPGAPAVKGAGQAGSSLILDGLTPQYVLKKGRFLTVETEDGSSAHAITAEVVADADGEVTVSFWPMLWLEPGDNDTVEIAEPYIEGLKVESGVQTSSGRFASVTTDSFVIEEG